MHKRSSGNLKFFTFAAALICMAGCDDGGGSSDTIDGQTSGNRQASSIGNQSPDPVVQDFPVFFIERPLVFNEDGDSVSASQRSLTQFETGANLMMKVRALPSADTINLTQQLLGPDADSSLYDIKDLAPDYAGDKLLFSMRGPFDPDADEDEQPTWNIWQYNLATGQSERIITSDTTAEAGQDREAQYLPNGEIVFTSTRQRNARAILLDEGRPQFSALEEDRNEEASVLHIMQDDGTNIEQITFNQSHDRDVVVTDDGHLIFNRWDNVPGRDVVSLYRSDMEGGNVERYYGYHSQNSGRDGSTVVFSDPRTLENGELLVIARDNSDSRPGGDLVIINGEAFVEIEQPTFANNSSSAQAQTSPLSEIVSLNSPSRRGRFSSVWPLTDGTNRLLISWAQCRLIESSAAGNNPAIVPCTDARFNNEDITPVEAPALYGLWILDPMRDLQQPVFTPDEGRMVSEAVVLAPRTTPFFMPNMVDDATQELINENVGVLNIRSIYDVEGIDTAVPDLATAANPVLTSAAQRQALFLRLVKPVSLPDEDIVDIPGTAFGRSQNERMKEILGYAPVHPDGSVNVKVPANIPFTISLINGNGERVSVRHRNWLEVKPGETKQCNGCHTSDSEVPHGRFDAEAPSINTGGPFSGIAADLVVDPGLTIAEAVSSGGVPTPSADIFFTDIWTDSGQRTPDADFEYRYQDLTTPAPASSACLPTWRANCRITIHYQDHIHPIWAVDRQTLDADGITVLQNFTCTSCHTNTDNDGLDKIPDSQLDLTDGVSNDQPDHFKSYRELFFNDNEQILDNGVLVDRLEPRLDNNGNIIFEVDEDGVLILDADGNPIPTLRTFNVPPTLNAQGAIASPAFFDRFREGGTHASYLTSAELKLIAEWIDIGGQYYNDPFVVPQQ